MATKPTRAPSIQKRLQAHPFANLLPMMDDDSFEALKAQIHRDGQKVGIMVYEGMILDGRNRYKALCELGVPDSAILFIDYDPEQDGDDPEQYVLDGNLHRRHLTGEQRVAIVAKKLGYTPTNGKPKPGAVTAAAVAKMAGVSVKTVSRAFNTADEATEKPAKSEKAAPTMESLLKQRAMVEGRLKSIDEQIAELQSTAKPTNKAPAPRVIARAPAATAQVASTRRPLPKR